MEKLKRWTLFPEGNIRTSAWIYQDDWPCILVCNSIFSSAWSVQVSVTSTSNRMLKNGTIMLTVGQWEIKKWNTWQMWKCFPQERFNKSLETHQLIQQWYCGQEIWFTHGSWLLGGHLKLGVVVTLSAPYKSIVTYFFTGVSTTPGNITWEKLWHIHFFKCSVFLMCILLHFPLWYLLPHTLSRMHFFQTFCCFYLLITQKWANMLDNLLF